uniref:HTH_48 domain-containing protein n=1 Tax=Angiostrongylus cantonensis TaxID=6313 RepID=A0A0K0DBW5_ANGCA
MLGITSVTPPVDELKEVFRRKVVHISDIVARHTKADVFSVHGFTRYIQSIVNKYLPEERFSAKERELGTYVLRKSFSHSESTPPLAKRSRMDDGYTVEYYDDNSRPKTSNGSGGKISESYFRKIFFYDFKLYCSAAETLDPLMKFWCKGSIGESTVRTWYFEDKGGCGHPNEHDDGELKVVVERNTQTTVRELAEQLGISKATTTH